MTKKDIVKTIAEQIDLPELRTRVLVQRTFDAIIEAIVEHGRVELRNFGVFQVKLRESRTGRNPRTGERVTVEAKSVVTFKPGKEMEERVRARDRFFGAGSGIADNQSIYEDMDDAISDESAEDTD